MTGLKAQKFSQLSLPPAGAAFRLTAGSGALKDDAFGAALAMRDWARLSLNTATTSFSLPA